MKTKTLASSLISISLLLAGGSAFADDMMKKDDMAKDGMKKETMAKDCKKDAMGKDCMAKDGMKKGAMHKDMMKRDRLLKCNHKDLMTAITGLHESINRLTETMKREDE